MSAIKEPLVIEITEEAYKQNSVYRPWDETKASEMAANSESALTQQRGLRALAAASGGLVLAAAGMPG
jgi:hypothetical protein